MSHTSESGCGITQRCPQRRAMFGRGPSRCVVARLNDNPRPRPIERPDACSEPLAQKPFHSAYHKRLILKCHFEQIPLPGIRCFWAVRIIGNCVNVFLRLRGAPQRGFWAGVTGPLDRVSVLMLARNGWKKNSGLSCPSWSMSGQNHCPSMSSHRSGMPSPPLHSCDEVLKHGGRLKVGRRSL